MTEELDGMPDRSSLVRHRYKTTIQEGYRSPGSIPSMDDAPQLREIEFEIASITESIDDDGNLAYLVVWAEQE